VGSEGGKGQEEKR